MSGRADHIAGMTFHGRKGAVRNAFTYSIDYVLMDAENTPALPWLFSRSGPAPFALHDRDHGGPPGAGCGAAWVRDMLAAHALPQPARIEILAQPRMLGYVFNPVSFWLCHDDAGALTTVIAEVTNTYGDRHSYLCRHNDHRPIRAEDKLCAVKLLHVSPFQPVSGGYEFRFDIRDDRIGIWIDYSHGDGGVLATLVGKRRPLALRGMVWAALRRPLGARRVLALIHWQALRLWWRNAGFRARPRPPDQEVSDG